MHKELNLILLEEHCTHHTYHQIYKTINDAKPKHLDTNIKTARPKTGGYLRSNDILVLEEPNFKLTITRKSCNYRGPVIWNTLEEDIKQCQLNYIKSALYQSSKL